MELLRRYQVIFDRFTIREACVTGGGQSFGYYAEDSLATKAWEKDVFVKQYHDVIPGSDESNLLGGHFSALRRRLAENSHYLCLPIMVGEVANSVVAAFPRIKGRSLQHYLKNDRTEEQRVRFAQAVTNAIRILHKAGIAHLDLKPENVLIEENSRSGDLYVRLIDTDAARIDGIGLRKKVYGSIGYMSPEHFAPTTYGDVSTGSDVFTLGIMLFELLFDCHPFADKGYGTYKETVERINVRTPPNEYHPEVVGRIISCLRLRPERRPQAGWVHSTLHNHSLTKFRAEAASSYVRLISRADAAFQRTYYETTALGRTSFRGCAIGPLPPHAVRLTVDPGAVFLEVLTSSVEVHVGFDKIKVGERYQLDDGMTIAIAGTRFAVEIGTA